MKKIFLLVLLGSTLFLGPEQVSETQTKSDTTQSKHDKDAPKIIALKSGEPDGLTYDAGTVRFLASSADTNGAWSLVENQKTTCVKRVVLDQTLR
jgi:hypothetical protein